MRKAVVILTTSILGFGAVVPHLPMMLVNGLYCPQPNSFGALTDLRQSANTPQQAQWLGVKSIRVLDRNNLWIVAHSMTPAPFAYSTFILHSSDGARSWEIKLRESAPDLNDVCFINHKVGWACGSGGLILKSTDGGKNWSEQDTPTEDDLDEIQFIDAEIGWAAGGKGEVLRTTDGGRHWTSHRIDVQGELLVLSFRDNLSGWLIGHENQAYESTDGGVSWKSRAEELARLAVGPSGWYQAYFQAVKFFGPKVGFIAAYVKFESESKGGADNTDIVEESVVFKTEDGGRSWRVLVSQKALMMNGAEFVSENIIWMILQKGTVAIHSEDGGKTWSKVSTLPSSDIMDLCFVDSRNGWAKDGNNPFSNRLYYTTDGGKNWTQSEWPRITPNRN
jgi:photosystem II stability/assembly factor-like uncharacterized protein